MQKKISQLTLKSYLDLHQLLSIYRGSHEKNRTFALADTTLKPLSKLLSWKDKYQYKITEELDSSKYLHYLAIFTSLTGFIMLLLGFSAGFALLSYSGAEPVNVIYLILVMVGIPLLSMSLSLLSMLTGDIGATIFSHLSPLYYLEKVAKFFSFSKNIDFANLPFSPTLSKWIFLQRIQLFSLLFSIGIFLALILMVIAKDIAFGWSTTLQVEVEMFQHLLASLSFPWHTFFPSAVPSLELVELSHYFRLGEHLDANMIKNADQLGAWWKFLAMATLTYAIVLRLIFWMMAHYGFKQQLQKEFLKLEGVEQLLQEFETAYVSTQSQKREKHLEVLKHSNIEVENATDERYHSVLGWNFSEDALRLIEDSISVHAVNRQVVGGKNSFLEDKKIMTTLEKSVLLYVKAWEPPTMDFMDFLEDVLGKREVKQVDVCPLGTASNGYKSKREDVEIWLRKLETVSSEKLGVIDV